MKHTPGPWKAVKRGENERGPAGHYEIVTNMKNGHDICIVQCVYKEANAHLIAKAPELLSALIEYHDREYSRIGHEGIPIHKAGECAECETCRLINEAKGE